MDSSIRFSLPSDSNTRLVNLCGVMDCNIQHLERALSVEIKRRGENFEINGAAAERAQSALSYFFSRADRSIAIDDIRLYLTGSMPGSDEPAKPARAESFKLASPRHFKPRTAAQQQFMEKINKHAVVICTGPAGTGKTHVAVAAALSLLHTPRARRLLLSRPVVEAGGERLGFLPGDMEKKVNPYLRPLYDILYQILGAREVERRITDGQIEVLPLAFMRGLTFNDSILILDEAQNTTPTQMKMLLSRLGENAKIIVCGDTTQDDHSRGVKSGLSDALSRLKPITEIGTHFFAASDIVRHPLVGKILTAYESD